MLLHNPLPLPLLNLTPCSFFDIAASAAAAAESIRLSPSFAASGNLFAKTTKSGGATKNKIGAPTNELREGPRFTPLAERHHQSHRQRDGKTKLNLLRRVVEGVRSAVLKFSTHAIGRANFNEKHPHCTLVFTSPLTASNHR